LAHFPRRKKDVGAAVVRNEKAEAVGMTLNRSCDEIELGGHAERALAIGHELAIALHRRDTSQEGFANLGLFDAERDGELVRTHGYAMFAQLLDDVLARRDVDGGGAGCAAHAALGRDVRAQLFARAAPIDASVAVAIALFARRLF